MRLREKHLGVALRFLHGGNHLPSHFHDGHLTQYHRHRLLITPTMRHTPHQKGTPSTSRTPLYCTMPRLFTYHPNTCCLWRESIAVRSSRHGKSFLYDIHAPEGEGQRHEHVMSLALRGASNGGVGGDTAPFINLTHNLPQKVASPFRILLSDFDVVNFEASPQLLTAKSEIVMETSAAESP